MIIYWSMLLLVPFMYLAYSVNHKSRPGYPDEALEGVRTKVPLFYALVIFGFFAFWIGMRGKMYDTWAYIEGFNKMPTDFEAAWATIDWDGKAPIFDAITVIFKCFFSQNYTWWLMTIAVISLGSVMIVLRNYSVDFFFSAFVFVSLNMYTWAMNGMRQFICVAILFLCCSFIKDKKVIRFILVALLMSTIHYTAILMIPVYFVARSKPWRLRIFLFVLVIILICIFTEPFFQQIEDTVLEGTAYEGATNQFDNDDGVNPLRAVFASVFPLIAYVRRRELEEHYEEEPMLPIAINMSLIAAALYIVGVFTSGILVGRLPIYCSVYNMLLIPYIIKYGFTKKDSTLIQLGMIVVLMIMFVIERPTYYMSELTGVLR